MFIEKPRATKLFIAVYAKVVICFEVVIEVVGIFIVSLMADVTDMVSARVSNMLGLGSVGRETSLTPGTFVELL